MATRQHRVSSASVAAHFRHEHSPKRSRVVADQQLRSLCTEIDRRPSVRGSPSFAMGRQDRARDHQQQGFIHSSLLDTSGQILIRGHYAIVVEVLSYIGNVTATPGTISVETAHPRNSGPRSWPSWTSSSSNKKQSRSPTCSPSTMFQRLAASSSTISTSLKFSSPN